MVAIILASSPSHAQLPYSEDFSTTTYRDNGAGQTTADWNTGFQQLLLPTSPSLTGPTFDEMSVVEVISNSGETQAIAIADLDGDGDLDLIDGVKGRTTVQFNLGAGTFGSTVYIDPEASDTRAIATGDIDRDGDIDFVDGSSGKRIRLFLNDGSGTNYVVQRVSDEREETSHLALADVNGDGFLDIVAANQRFERNVLYTNTGDPLVPFGEGGKTKSFIGGNIRESSRHVVVGDLDKDGDIDIVFVNEDERNPNNNNFFQRNRIFMNELAQGVANSFITYEIDNPGSDDVDFSVGAALGDLNGDGYLDLVVVNQNEGEASKIYLNNGSGIANADPFTTAAIDFTIATSPSDPSFAAAVSLADADKDGDLDIFLVSKNIDFRNRVYFNDGSGMNFTPVDVGPVGQAPLSSSVPGNIGVSSTASAVGDIDGDGDIDWVVGNFDFFDPSKRLANNVFRNRGTDGSIFVQQLRARATSLQVDASGIDSVRLFPAPTEGMIGNEFLNQVDYWVSGNGGASWKLASPDGRPVALGAGTDVRWRAVLRSESPATAAGLAVFQLNIAANTSGPTVVTPIVSATVNEGDSATGLPIVADFVDADGDPLFYSVTGLPLGTGLAIDPFTGEISGTPTNEDSLASPATLTVFATDGALSATDTFTLTVINENDPPAFVSTPPAGNAVQGTPYSYAIFADDPDPNETANLRFSAPTLPAWLTLTDNLDGSATLSGTPGNADVTGDNSVTLVVTDPGGLTDTQSFVITVDNINDQPVFTSTAVTTATEDLLYTYAVTADDPDVGETAQLSISATVAPAWLTLTDNGDGTATLSGTPGNGDVTGDNSVTLVVTDPGGLTDTQSFVVTVQNANDAPVFTSTPVTTGTQDQPYSYVLTADDVDDGETALLSYSATIAPSWLTLTDNGDGTATLSGTPGNADVSGDNSVTLIVTDPGGLTDTQSFVITVGNVNDQPAFTSTPPAGGAVQGMLYTYAVTANDPDNGETAQLAYSATVAPAWLTLTDNGDGTAALSGTPGNGDVTGDNSVTLVVTDPGGLTDTQSFVVTVQNANDAPVFTSTPVTTGTQDQPYSYVLTADDVDDGETALLSYSATIAPSWLTLTDNGDGTATLSGTPGNADVSGDNSVTLIVTDPGGLTDTQSFVITVGNVNDQPAFTSTPPAGGAVQGMPYTYAVSANDPDNGETAQLAYSATVAPAWLTLTDNGDGTATLSGTPGNAAVFGDNSVTLVVTDPGGLTDTQSFVVTVQNANDAPVFTSTPVTTATQDQLYGYSVSASDADPGDTSQLTITASTIPGWLTLTDNGDGTASLAGTPGEAQVGVPQNVSLVVTDPAGATNTQDFVIDVQNVNDAPVFTSSPPAGGASTGNVYTYNVTASDPDAGETAMLVFAAPTLPGWLTFTDNADGTAILTGTPTPADAAGNNAVTLTVTDPAGLSDTQSFTIVVVNVNRAPQFVSSPPTVARESQEYRYSIRAVDANDDGITISAVTLPGWLTLVDHGGGFARISGTPGGSDVGDHTVVLEAREQAPAPGLTGRQQFVIRVTSTGSGPEITLNGAAEIGIFLGDNYNDPGATAVDAEDGDLTSQITTTSNVDTSKTGFYTVRYSVFDSAGNEGQASRIVRVVAKPNPNTGIGAAGVPDVLLLLLMCVLMPVIRRSNMFV